MKIEDEIAISSHSPQRELLLPGDMSPKLQMAALFLNTDLVVGTWGT